MFRYSKFIHISTFLVFIVAAQSGDVRRCLQFTWISRTFNNRSEYLSETCGSLNKTNRGFPCVKPLLLSSNGSWPGVDNIWRHYPEASCTLANTDVCARYTYYFEGEVENSTYFCTRAVDENKKAIRSGCYQQLNGSFLTEVCLCEPVPGENMPCNNSFVPNIKDLTITIIGIAYILQFFVNIN